MRQYLMLALLAGLAASTLGGLYLAVRQAGHAAGFAEASAACAAERQRMEDANRAAIRSAEQQLLRTADELAQKSKELDDALAATDEATAADPRGPEQCLAADGLRRLNAIR